MHPFGPNRPEVVLVGPQRPGDENLGLAYLLAALREEQIPAVVAPLDDRSDPLALARWIAGVRPSMVGLSLPDERSALRALDLGDGLRGFGHRGRIVAGGTFATLAREWLLTRFGWLDGVIRHAGERPLVELILRLRMGRIDLHDLPGVTTRSGDGPATPVPGREVLKIRPARDGLPEFGGVRTARMLATRGCPERCGYSAPVAAWSSARREARQAGTPSRALRHIGAGRVRQRRLADLCAEMATLWHRDGARYFTFSDEQLLPRDETAARHLLGRLRRHLHARGVGRIAIGASVHPDSLTRPVQRSLEKLGLVEARVTVELASKEELTLYGRHGDPFRAAQAMRGLQQRMVATSCRLLLVHPYSSVERVDGAIRFLEGHPDSLVEVARMRVHHGTLLCDHLRDRGRLLGNPLSYRYKLLDPVTERFAGLLDRLLAEAFSDHVVTRDLRELRRTLALTHRLEPGIPVFDLWQRTADLVASLGRSRAAALRAALHLARRGADRASADQAITATRRHFDLLAIEIVHLSALVENRLKHRVSDTPPPLQRYQREASASGF